MERLTMTRIAKKRKAGWTVALALLAGAAVIVPSMISLAVSVFAAFAKVLE
ncbi:MAG TPA: hypothetical protein VGE05_02090 [Novosphingobium sp.]